MVYIFVMLFISHGVKVQCTLRQTECRFFREFDFSCPWVTGISIKLSEMTNGGMAESGC